MSDEPYNPIRGKSDFVYFAEYIWGEKMEDIHMPLIRNLLSDDNSVNILSRGCGKSEITIRYAIWRVMKERNLTIGIVSSAEKQSVRLLNKIKQYIAFIPELRTLRPDAYPDELEGWEQEWAKLSITTSTKCKIMCVPFNDSIRGFRFDLIICDDILRDEDGKSTLADSKALDIFEGAVEFAVSNVGVIKVLGTPMSDTDLLANLYKNRDDFEGYKQSVAILDKTGKIMGSRFEFMYPLEKLLTKQRNMSTANFNKEILLRPVTDSNAIFTSKMLNENIDASINSEMLIFDKTRTYFLGVDIALSDSKEADYTVFTVTSRDKSGTLRRDFVKRKKGMNTENIINEVLYIDSILHCGYIKVENNGLAYGVHQSLDSELTLRGRYEGVHTSRQYKFKILGQLEVALKNGRLLHDYDKVYFHEMSGVVYYKNKLTGDDEYKFLRKHDDTVMSMALSLDAALNKLQSVMIVGKVKKSLFGRRR